MLYFQIFMAYLYSVSSLFLIYLQVLMYIEKPKDKRPDDDSESGIPQGPQGQTNHSFVLDRHGTYGGSLASHDTGGGGPDDVFILRRRAHTITEDQNPHETADEEAEEEEDLQEIEEYILVHSQTASLAHEGTSFYMRIGLMCEYADEKGRNSKKRLLPGYIDG